MTHNVPIVFLVIALFSAHKGIPGGCYFSPFRIDAFNPHGAGIVAGSAFRTGCAVFFQLEQIKLVEHAQQISHRAHQAPEPFDKETACQQGNRKEPSQSIIHPPAAHSSGKHFIRADVTEIAANKYKPQKQDNPNPFQRLDHLIHTVSYSDWPDMQRPAKLVE